MKKVLYLDGCKITSSKDFHSEVAAIFGFPDFYGKNLDALWDCLTGHVDLNVKLVWHNHAHSKKGLKKEFDEICKLLSHIHDEYPDFCFCLD